jgi:hypothetical protein
VTAQSQTRVAENVASGHEVHFAKSALPRLGSTLFRSHADLLRPFAIKYSTDTAMRMTSSDAISPNESHMDGGK